MSRVLRSVAACTGGVLVASLLAGCVGVQTTVDRDSVLAAVAATEAGPRDITWTQSERGTSTTVTGTVVDDLRWAMTATSGGHTLAAEVVDDQARALQLPDAHQLSRFEAASGGAAVQQATIATLRTGAWVVDAAGSSSLRLADTSGASPDVLVTALGVLEHVRTAIAEADNTTPVVRHNVQSPGYAPLDDFFPQPSAGEVRYDLVPPPLPPPQQAGQGAAVSTSKYQVAMFRSMAVYLRGGRVVAVTERVGVTHAMLEDISSRLAQRGITVPADWAHVAQLEAGLNAINNTGQAGAIRWLTSSATIAPSAAHDVQLPATATPGSLAGIGTSQQVLSQS